MYFIVLQAPNTYLETKWTNHALYLNIYLLLYLNLYLDIYIKLDSWILQTMLHLNM